MITPSHIHNDVRVKIALLHLPLEEQRACKQCHRLELHALLRLLFPLGVVVGVVLLLSEARSSIGLGRSSLAMSEGQRLDIATESLLIDPSTILEMQIEAPPQPSAVAFAEIDGSSRWTLGPPPVLEGTSHAAAPLHPRNEQGVYLTPSSVGNEDLLRDTMDRLTSSPHPALVIDVKGSYVYFASGAPLATELKLVRPYYDLQSLIEEAHQRNIRVIARFIALKDPSLAIRKPETQIRHPLRGRSVGPVWVDGGNDTTLQYNREILEDLVMSGIDEINLDYIRYPTEYAQQSIGLSGAQKAERITEFLRMARAVIDASGRDVRLGISTFAILGWNFPVNFEPLGQDIAAFAEIVDVISPMAYPSTFSIHAYYDPSRDKGSRMYHLVRRTLEGYRELVGESHAHKIRPWIQGYGVTEKNMSDQIQAVYDAGFCGFTVWSASNAYQPTYKALQKMEVPDACK